MGIYLKPCPYCGNGPETYSKTDYQSAGIYCSKCPLGVEDNTASIEELAFVWNNLPRRNNEEQTM